MNSSSGLKSPYFPVPRILTRAQLWEKYKDLAKDNIMAKSLNHFKSADLKYRQGCKNFPTLKNLPQVLMSFQGTSNEANFWGFNRIISGRRGDKFEESKTLKTIYSSTFYILLTLFFLCIRLF